MQAMNTVQDLMIQTLGELHATERRQLEALPMLLHGAQTPELREALQQHERETRTHVQRLEQIFQQMGRPAQDVSNPVFDAMVSRGSELLQAAGNPEVREAALICEAQKFEHLEIAAYGTAASLAKQVGNQQAAQLLAQTLQEEKQSNERLSRIAEGQTNPQAAGTLQQFQQQQRPEPRAGDW